MITRRGKPVADLVPHGESPDWVTPQQVLAIITNRAADPALRSDLERIAGDTTDDLGPIR